jgi:hypothetical protein
MENMERPEVERTARKVDARGRRSLDHFRVHCVDFRLEGSSAGGAPRPEN